MKFLFSLFIIALTTTAQAQTAVWEANEVITKFKPQFGTGNAVLHINSDRCLREIWQYLNNKPAVTLMRVECHAESPTAGSGNKTAADLQLLSEERAMAVCKRLIEMGIDCKRLIAVGFGGTKPVLDNNTYKERASNGRIIFVNAALKGHPIGGRRVDGGGHVPEALCN